jgi:hypothetical protein
MCDSKNRPWGARRRKGVLVIDPGIKEDTHESIDSGWQSFGRG